MKTTALSFMQMLSSVRRDKMLFIACCAPLLTGLFFKFGIPAAQDAASSRLGMPAVLTPYYGLFDLFFSMLTPTMFCFAAAMVLLEENDDHVGIYYSITPLERNGYLLSRIFIPALLSFVITFALLPIFRLTPLSLTEIAVLSIMGALQGALIALLVITVSSNKLEGMAVTKLSTLTMMGVLVPYFINGRIQYVFSLLPSFWIGKAIYAQKPVYALLSISLALLWCAILLRRYLRKIL